MMEKIKRLESELKEAQDKIARICKWITDEYGIIIPEFILNPAAVASDSDGDPEDTYTFNRKIELVQVLGDNLKSEQYDENDDLTSTVLEVEDHLYSDFDENEYIEKIPGSLSSKLSSKNAIKIQMCKPCCVLLPPRIDHQSHVNVNVAQIIPAQPLQVQLQLHKKVKTKPTIGHKETHYEKSKNLRRHWRDRLKKRPTEDEKISALDLYKTSTNFLDINCPVCSVSIKSIKNCRSQFKLHLVRMHYFHEKELDILIPSFRKRNRGPKIQLTQEQKLQVLQSLQNYSDSGPLACPACPNKKFSHDGQIMRLKYRFKSHLKTVHMLTHHDFAMFKADQDQKSKSLQNHPDSDDNFASTNEDIEEIPAALQSQKLEETHYAKTKSRKRKHWRERLKKLPTECEKMLALDLYKSSASFLNVKCPICSANIINNQDLRQSFKLHLIRMHYFEEKEFNNIPRVKRHEGGHKKSLLCTVCGKTFAHSKYLKIHSLRAHSSSKPTFQCDICSSLFHFKGDLNLHKSSHLTEKNYICQVCGCAFKKLPYLSRHLQIHSEDRREYKCLVENCEKTFITNEGLQSHTKILHIGLVRNFHCDKCNLAFFKSYSLLQHRLAVHEGVRPFKCTICPSAFKTKTHLKYHINTHSNPKAKKRGYNKPKDL